MRAAVLDRAGAAADRWIVTSRAGAFRINPRYDLGSTFRHGLMATLENRPAFAYRSRPARVRAAGMSSQSTIIRLPTMAEPSSLRSGLARKSRCRLPKSCRKDWTMAQRRASQRTMSLVFALLGALRASLRTRTELALENLALRQQLVLLRRRSKRPQFGRRDRLFCVWLSLSLAKTRSR